MAASDEGAITFQALECRRQSGSLATASIRSSESSTPYILFTEFPLYAHSCLLCLNGDMVSMSNGYYHTLLFFCRRTVEGAQLESHASL